MAKELNRYVPNNYQIITKDESLGIEVWGINSQKPCAIAYSGKRGKCDWHFNFRSIEAMTKHIDEYVLRIQKRHAEKVAARQNKKSIVHDVKVGEIFSCSWGYDQTNIDYWQVVKLVGKSMMEVRKIARKSQATGCMTGECVPAVNHFVGEPEKKLIQMCGNKPYFRAYSFASASREEPIAVIAGVPIFETAEYSSYA